MAKLMSAEKELIDVEVKKRELDVLHKKNKLLNEIEKELGI